MVYTKAPQLKKQRHAENAFQVCFDGHILTNRIILLFIEIMMLIVETDKMLGVTSHFTYIGPAFIRMLIVLMIEKKNHVFETLLACSFPYLGRVLFHYEHMPMEYATILKAVKMIIFS